MHRSLIALLAFALAVPALAAPAVTGATIRANPVTGRASAGYLTVTGDSKPDRLVAVTSPGLKIEMHSMSMTDGIMRMAKLDGLDVPARGRAEFASGGNHLMIYGLAAGAKTVPLTLVFRSGAKVSATAAVRSAADAMDHGNH